MVKSITTTKSKIWIGIDFTIFGLSVFLFVFVSQQAILLLIIAIAILYRIKWRSDTVIINDTQIQIQNWFTASKTILEIKKVEKYAYNAEAIMGERLILISNDLVVAKIRHKNYSNMNELLDYLDSKLKRGDGGIAQQ
jgi:hypothetical protein